jgi:hypothetical protein
MPYVRRFALLVTLALGACSTEQAPHSLTDAGATATPGDRDAAAPPPGQDDAQIPEPDVPDPFAPQPDVSEGLVNVSADLEAVLEYDQVRGACEAYRGGQTDRATMLRCGKWMFFWEGFGTQGVPKALVKFLLDKFPDELGPGFSKLGMIPDPTSKENLPLGMAPGARLGGSVESLAFTCASCHFARLPDGRYAVGAPNHDYDYKRQNLAFMLVPTLGLGLGGGDHDPAAVALVQPLLDKLKRDPFLQLELGASLLPLITAGTQVPTFTREIEAAYASWKPGTMDFFIAPLPFDDGVHTISKISALWGLPDDDEVQASGMPSAMLGWTGGTYSLTNFVSEFVDLGGGVVADWPDDKLRPLVEYIYSLRAPDNPSPPPADQVARGRSLFFDKGCTRCHAGPRGSGTQLYSYEEIGTDPQLKKWADPELTGEPCCDLRFRPGSKITHAIKSPRLTGAWAMKRFLHNGSLDSLEELFCTEKSRPSIDTLGHGDGGHLETCENLDDEEKRALIAYLRSI